MFANLEKDRLEVVREKDQLTFMLNETPNSVVVDIIESVAVANCLVTARLFYGGVFFSVILTQVICLLKFNEFFPPFALILAVVGGIVVASEAALSRQRSTISHWADVLKARVGPPYMTLAVEATKEEACS